ncbi:unnamed protein product [Lymnaea stagnalis]|uniref:Uncharacterized protein n=1 Tax=Lymnaea stagnalis TaxID=6523 RepID=A0AAV2HN65_LYMST
MCMKKSSIFISNSVGVSYRSIRGRCWPMNVLQRSRTVLTNEEMWIVWLSCLAVRLTSCDTPPDYDQPPSPSWSPGEGRQDCSVWEQTGCSAGECCVKEVITFEDLDRNPWVSTTCKPHLAIGELCLRQPEGYLCDCSSGSHCEFKNNETYGLCAPG